MGYTKQQLIEEAFSEMGMAEYVFDLSPEGLQGALRRMDAMLASWYGLGVSLGYLLPVSPAESNLSDASGLPDWAVEAVVTNLAIKLAPSYGKQVNPATKANAKAAYDVVLKRCAMPGEMRRRAMPAGAGHKTVWSNSVFLPETPESLDTGSGSSIVFE